MEVETPVQEDEAFLPHVESSARPNRVWSLVSVLAIFVVAGWSGRSVWISANVEKVTSLHEKWYAAWTSQPQRVDANQCTWDGDDCRSSRCCAKEGSRCFVKNHHWASCNETCHTHRKWQGYVDRRGHWTVTDYPVWQCADITATKVVAETVTVTVPVPVPAPAPELSSYSIYEKDHDLRTKTYGARTAPKAAEETVTLAPVTWEDYSTSPAPCAKP